MAIVLSTATCCEDGTFCKKWSILMGHGAHQKMVKLRIRIVDSIGRRRSRRWISHQESFLKIVEYRTSDSEGLLARSFGFCVIAYADVRGYAPQAARL